MSLPMGGVTPRPACPGCGAPYETGASFCEGCGRDLTAGTAPSVPARPSDPAERSAWAVADPVTAAAGEESPLDVGWTGPVAREPSTPAPGAAQTEGAPCHACGEGHVVDGYCDVCGSKARDPRDHYEEEPAPWVAGVCDIGRRHSRNEDALALHAEPAGSSFAVLVVCDGVSNTLDSHVASLAASRAARDVLDDPLPRGVGTRTALVAAARARIDAAVRAAHAAVLAVTPAAAGAASPGEDDGGETDGTGAADRAGGDGRPDGGGDHAGDDGGTGGDRERDALVPPAEARRTAVDNPPSCTVVAVVVSGGVAVVGNVGDSRAYWLPDDPARPATQLSRDDSFAQEQMEAGVPRAQAETGPGSHAITRWLGVDSPEDLTPHGTDLDLDHDGWLVVCSDGLWNYASEAADLRVLLRATVTALGPAGHHPLSVARALTDWANARGGVDNISVALARVGEVVPAPRPATDQIHESTQIEQKDTP